MIAALICGRAENQPFSGRNTFPLLGRPLAAYPMLAAAHSEEVGATFLSTDDAGLMRLAQHHGIEVIDRPPQLSGAEVPLEDVIAHAYQEIGGRVSEPIEALVVLLANAPTVTNGQIDQAVRMLRDSPDLDAVTSVSLHNEFHPAYALRLQAQGRVIPYNRDRAAMDADVYFPDALLWVLRPPAFFGPGHHPVQPNWIVDVATQRVGALVHEGYGDIDYAWQIPAVEEWLRRRGFDEGRTPYPERRAPEPARPPVVSVPGAGISLSPNARRVLVTTVPFGQVNPHSIALLENAGIEFVINPIGRRLTEQELVEMAPAFGVLIAGTEPITARVMAAAPHLRLISRVGVGLDNVDLAEARARGINVSYTPEAPAPAVAELAVGLMLALLRNIPGADRNLRSGVWHRFMGRRISELTIGVIGVGRIGTRVIRHLAGGFPGVRLLANDLAPEVELLRQHDVHWVDKDTIFREADVVTLHLPLTRQTRRLVTAREMAMMKPTSILINTSRGTMVDESDLARMLREDRLGGAGIDVFEREPYSGELASLDRCVLTCHMGSMSQDCRAKMEIEATEEVVRFLTGEALQCVVPESEYLAAGVDA